MTSKKCTKCKEERPIKDFYETKTTKDGFTYNCRKCYHLYRETHREEQKGYMRDLRVQDKEKVNSKKREYFLKQDPIKKVFLSAQSRSRRNGTEFSISQSDIELPTLCPLLDCPFMPGYKDHYKQAYSLDRKDPTKGYIPGNVWMVSARANTMKSDATIPELLKFALNIIKHFGDDDIVRTMWKHLESQDKEPEKEQE